MFVVRWERESTMGDKHWNELEELGQKMNSLSRMLDRAREYGDAPQVQHLSAQITHVQQLRDKILVSIAEISIAA
jgi:hypothetical protein